MNNTREWDEELIKELLAEVEIALTPQIIRGGHDWEMASIVLGDLIGKLINRVRDDEIEKATQVWLVYIEKLIGSIDNRLKAKEL